MSFSSLPTELVHQIIESYAPTLYLPGTYRERQRSLSCLCLVSRRFLLIARPLLFRIIRIDTSTELNTLLDVIERNKWSELLHQVVISVDGTTDYEQDFARVARLGGQSLRSMAVQVLYSAAVDLSFLHSFPRMASSSVVMRKLLIRRSASSGLTSLQLSDDENEGGTFSLHARILLPDLHSLIATYSTLLKSPALLDPDIVPSLTALVITDLYGAPDLSKLEGSKISKLTTQLEHLQLPWNLAQRAPPFLQKRLDSVLLEAYRYELIHLIPAQPSIEHLRVIEGEWGRKIDPLHQIHEFTSWIKSPAQTTLRSLYLDVSLNNPSKQKRKLLELVNSLLQACEAKKVEVIFEVQPSDEGYGAVFSEEFCRRQRVRRRPEAAQTTPGAKGTGH